MENFSTIKLNNVREKQNTAFEHKFIYDVMPRPQCRNLSYVDSRLVELHNPYARLGSIPKQIAAALDDRISENPNLAKLLSNYNLNARSGNYINFMRFTDRHMQLTAEIASRICDELKIITDEKNTIVKAARLHDIGKIFIPETILNKPKNLSMDEKPIMDSHANLGYNLLKTLNIDNETLELIKNHHNADSSSSKAQQIVSVSDVYAALIEKRHYKPSLSSKQAINIIERLDFSKDVIDALEKVIGLEE